MVLATHHLSTPSTRATKPGHDLTPARPSSNHINIIPSSLLTYKKPFQNQTQGALIIKIPNPKSRLKPSSPSSSAMKSPRPEVLSPVSHMKPLINLLSLHKTPTRTHLTDVAVYELLPTPIVSSNRVLQPDWSLHTDRPTLSLPTATRTTLTTLPHQLVSADYSHRAVRPLLSSDDYHNRGAHPPSCGDIFNHVHSCYPPLMFPLITTPPLLLPHQRDTVLPRLHYFTARIVQRT